MSDEKQRVPRFAATYCSQCGEELGPGDHGVSHCGDHAPKQNTTQRQPRPHQSNLRLPPDVALRLRGAAHVAQISVSAWVRQVVTEALDRGTLYEQIEALVKAGAKGGEG